MGGETSSRATSQYPQLAAGPVGKLIEGIYTDRLKQLTSGGQYEKENLRAKLYHNTNDDEDHVKSSVYSPPNLTRPTFKDATSH